MPKITPHDRVIVSGKFLVYERDPTQRFRMRGLAFPVPHDIETTHSYKPNGWIAILKQLRQASPELNTLRLYRIPAVEGEAGGRIMDSFYQAAADLGFYLLVPLTSAQGDGVLNRDDDAPDCYRPALYHYGVRVIDSVRDHPNVLGGVIGNEVLNSLADWPAAPCLLAYARDLKLYDPSFPLIYTTQHDGITAEVTPAQTVQLLAEYLTCHSNDETNHTNSFAATIDILGVNIESWCSSLGTFERNEDGTKGSYLDVYEHLMNSTVPIIFSELGCGQNFFDRDNGLGTPLEGSDHLKAREWKQIQVVETNMVDEFSGYLAYAYDGPIDFRMTTGGPWDGVHPLEFNMDMRNYLQALKETSSASLPVGDTAGVAMAPTCASVHEFLQNCCHLDLLDVNEVPSYYVYTNTTTATREITAFHHSQPMRDVFMYPLLLSLLIMTVTLFYSVFHRCCTFKVGSEEERMETDGEPQKSYSTFA